MESISTPLNQLILVLGGWTVVLGGLLVWTGRILAERITSAWRQYENEKLETMKHGFTSDRVLLENAIRGAQQGLDSIQTRRLSAIEALWNSVLKLRADFTGSIFFYEILSPEEYEEVFKRGDPMAASIRDLSDDTTMAAMRSVDSVEAERPYLGETLWLKFFVYRAFLGRLAHLLIEGKRSGHFTDWRKDSGVLQIVANVLSQQTVDGISGVRIPAISIRHVAQLTFRRSMVEYHRN
jgi:hypothetical protein